MDALKDLEPILGSRKAQLTPDEVNLLEAGKFRALRDFYVGFWGGAFVSWQVAKRLKGDHRVAVSACAVVTGALLFDKSVRSTVEQLISLQGTRVQGELVNTMITKDWNRRWVQEQIFKYFYPEVVYTDASIDKPVHRWRYRNIYGEPVTPESTPQRQETDSKEKGIHVATMKARKAYVNAVVGENGNPFDLVFGHPESAEDVYPNDARRSPSRRQARREKRQRRRHMRHHQVEAEI